MKSIHFCFTVRALTFSTVSKPKRHSNIYLINVCMKKVSLKNIPQRKNNGEEKREISLEGFFFNMYIRRKHITSPCLEQTSFLWHWCPCPASNSARSTLSCPPQWDTVAGILAPNLSAYVILNTLKPFSSSQDPTTHALRIGWMGLGARSIVGRVSQQEEPEKIT